MLKKLCVALWFFFAGTVLFAQSASKTKTTSGPAVIKEPSAKDWVVDRFVGNSTAGPILFQGPALEAGLSTEGIPSVATAPDGRVFVVTSEGIAEVSPGGMMRLIVSREEWAPDGIDDF
jgi:hypothetical protein